MSRVVYAGFAALRRRYGSFGAGAAMVLAAVILIGGLVVGATFGCFAANTIRRKDVSVKYITGSIKMADEDGDGVEEETRTEKTATLPPEQLFLAGGEIYICLTDLNRRLNLGMRAVGDGGGLRVTLENGSSAVFRDGGTGVAIDDSPLVALGNPAIIDNRKLYLPLSFVQRYTSGVNISYDREENLLTVDRPIDREATAALAETKPLADEPVYEPFAFTVMPPAPLSPVAPPG